MPKTAARRAFPGPGERVKAERIGRKIQNRPKSAKTIATTESKDEKQTEVRNTYKSDENKPRNQTPKQTEV
jgi:hypothetical protein